ncbi:hypothetical protein AB0M43_34780 [Longispora sp. NPDC051575]|uniref:hypothetical protein n=1 Tax=Longispora sp. NPDC051575 TaxID=3154943 RepID=UPI00343B5275
MTLTILPARAITRFPLTANTRPTARPLHERLRRLTAKATAARADGDATRASQVLNGAALLASDCRDAILAREWCHRHAILYLDQAPLDGPAARAALEPVVNIARLAIRTGDSQHAHELLTNLHHAVANRSAVTIDGLAITPAHMPTDPAEHAHLCGWLREVLCSDGTRALTTAGRWADAHRHLQRYRGVGARLFVGRQVAIICSLLDGDNAGAGALLQHTLRGEPWEQAVRSVLAGLHRHTTQPLSSNEHRVLLDAPLNLQMTEGLGHTLFRTRLTLAAVDITGGALTEVLTRLGVDILAEEDAHAARELLTHPAATMRPDQRHAMTELIAARGINGPTIPDDILDQLLPALDYATFTIRQRR